MKREKSLGQVFTPTYIVDMILDELSYFGEGILGEKILEPSFGEGAFLIPIAKRYLDSCRRSHLSEKETQKGLNDHIYGIELDETLFKETKSRLNHLLEDFGIGAIAWENLHLGNALTYDKESGFDYIAGNPPYIRVHNLDEETRKGIGSYRFSSGTTDMYILFFEKCLGLLRGKLGFITPNSFMKNSSQSAFRKHLIDNNLLTGLTDFKSSRVFDDASTYTAITLLDMDKKSPVFIYKEQDQEKNLYEGEFSVSDYGGNPWCFGTKKDLLLLTEISQRSLTLGKRCTVQNGIATNRDAIYTGETAPIKGLPSHLLFNGAKMEKGILRPVVKGTTYDGERKGTMILFPYEWTEEGGRYEVMEEELLRTSFPLAYAYLLSHKEELDKRDMDRNAAWYQFGRSQGLLNGRFPKLVLKNVFDARKGEGIQVFELEEEVLVYSGIYITAPKEELSLIREVLSSKEFFDYAKLVGKDLQGGWKSLGTKHIKNFGVEALSGDRP